MEKLLETLQQSLGESLPGVFGALVLLVIGWLVAVIAKFVIKKVLHLLKLNERLTSKGGGGLDLEGGLAVGGYFIILLMVLLSVFNQLGLEVASKPIQALVSQLLDFIPSVISGGILILVAWLCSTILKQIVTGGLAASGIDEKMKSEKKPLSQALGEISFWLVFLIFLPGILGVFNLQGLLEPVQSMVDKIVGMFPNIIGATIIIFVGWFIAKILRDIVTNLLNVAGADKLGEKIGLSESVKLSKTMGLLVYILVFVPAIVAGLNALKIEAIAKPATGMLNSFIAAIPNIIAALAIILITYLVAKPVSGFISTILGTMGLDGFPQKIGIKKGKNGASASVIAGKAVFFFMMLFAFVEAANRVQFHQFSELVATFIQFGSQILLGSIIIATGLWIANIVAAALQKAPGTANVIAGLVRVIIVGLVFAMGLRAMGIANDIVNMAFGLTLGAAAVAFAIAFGFGGRDAAGKQLEYWFSKIRK